MEEMKIHDPGNTAPINMLWAWLSVDEKGNEGIVGSNLGPMVSGKKEIMKAAEKMVRRGAEECGKRVVLAAFMRVEMQ